jgi:4-hydroxy-tetrahydrodipicolinate synthase
MPESSVTDRLKGAVVPINICFTEDGEVDFAAMRKYVGWLAQQKTPVLLLTYGSSEYSWLSDEDIWRLTAELAEEVAGRSLFITSSSWWPPKVCRDFLRHAERSGVDAVKIQINMWAMGGPQRRELFLAYYDQIQDASSIPLLLWCNSAGGDPLPIDLVVEMAGRPRIVGLKNDDHPFYYYYDLCRATRDEDFAVISGGQMRNFVFGYQIGSPAYLCTIAPFRPDIALEFHDLLEKGDIDGAWQMVFRYEDTWLSGAGEIGWLRAIKTAIHLHGLLPGDRVGGTWAGHTADEGEKVRQLLQETFGPIEKVAL